MVLRYTPAVAEKHAHDVKAKSKILVRRTARPDHCCGVIALNAVAVRVCKRKVRLRKGVALLSAHAEEARRLRKVVRHALAVAVAAAKVTTTTTRGALKGLYR